MFQTQQAHHQAPPPPPPATQWGAATDNTDVNFNVNVSTSGLRAMGSLGSMGSMDGMLEDLIMSDTVMPLGSSDDIVNLSTYYDNTGDDAMMDVIDEAPMTETYPTTHPGASRSLARVVSKDSKGEQCPIQNVSPFQRAPVATPAAVPPQPQQSNQQHPEDFSFDKFFANYDLPPHLQPPTPVNAQAPQQRSPSKKKRSHRRAHTVGSYDMFESVAPPAHQQQQPQWAALVPPAVHVVSAGAAPAAPVTEMIPPLSMGDPLDHYPAAAVASPVSAAVNAAPPSPDPILAFLTNNNAQGASTMDSSAPISNPQKPKGRHRRIRSEGSAVFGNPGNMFFTNAGITNVMMELAADTPVPKTSPSADVPAGHITSIPKSTSSASLLGSSLEAVPEKKAMVPDVLPDLSSSHTHLLAAETTDTSQFMNHGTEAAWLENLQSSPMAGA